MGDEKAEENLKKIKLPKTSVLPDCREQTKISK